SHRASTEDDRRVTVAASLALNVRTVPWQTRLDLPDLRERLLGDGQWLHENRHVAQLARHDVHILLVVNNVLGHEAVGHVDAALREVAGVAEVLTVAAAGQAGVVIAGPPHHRDHEIADLDPGHGTADLDHLAQR